MKVIELEDGKVEYHVPNIAEGMILLGEMGFSSEQLESMGSKDGEVKDTYFLGHLLNKMDKFVDKIKLKAEDEDGKAIVINNYDSLLRHGEYFASVLMPIATDILKCLSVDSKKKKPTRKRSR